jgi:large subunit ribosomal protein L25
MATVDLKCEIRTKVGKEAARRIRQAQRIPGVVYGGPGGPIPVQVKPQDLLTALVAGENVLINLSLVGGGDGQRRTVILKELQLDPVKGRPLHADFLEITMERKIRVQVPLVLTGDPVGVKGKGGILEQPLRQLSVECLPLNIPDRISVDVANLDIGNAIHVRDLIVGEGVRILEDPARVVASVTMPAAEEVVAPVEEKPAEPELVGKKEKVEEEPEPEAKGKAKAEAKPEAKPEAKAKQPEGKGKPETKTK